MTRIYVASLSDYNAGHLLGRWIELDANTERSDIAMEIAEMLRESKYPNVHVTCPDCNGTYYKQEGVNEGPCPTCNGTGSVPSAEEWAAHDYDDIPSEFGEHPDLDDVLEFVQGVEEHGDAFRAFVEWQGITNFIHQDFLDAYSGEATSELAWVENHLEETGVLSEMPENLRSYFDAEAYLRDMKLGGDVSFECIDGTHYAFWN